MGKSSQEYISSILNVYMYLNNKDAKSGDSLETILNKYEGNHPQEMEILRQAIVDYPELKELKLTVQSNNMGEEFKDTGAAVFKNTATDDVYVAFVGTQDREWLDNGRGLAERKTEQQENATKFFDTAAAQQGWTEKHNIIVSGHSKGGNKAQFITLDSQNQNLIDSCYSFDGQGFSPEAIQYYKKELGNDYQKALDKMYGVHGENDYVNRLGTQIIPDSHTKYITQNAADQSGLTDKFVNYHDLVYLFADRLDENGNPVFSSNMNSEADGPGAFSRYMAVLSDNIMKLPASMRKRVSLSVMQAVEFKDGSPFGLKGEFNWNFAADLLGMGVPIAILSIIPFAASEIWNEFSDWIANAKDKIDIPGFTGAFAFFFPWFSGIPGIMNITTDIFEKISDRARDCYDFFISCYDTMVDFGAGLWEKITEKNHSTEPLEMSFEIDIISAREQSRQINAMSMRLNDLEERLNQTEKYLHLSAKLNPLILFQIHSTGKRLENHGKATLSMNKSLEQICGLYKHSDQFVKTQYEGVL